MITFNPKNTILTITNNYTGTIETFEERDYLPVIRALSDLGYTIYGANYDWENDGFTRRWKAMDEEGEIGWTVCLYEN